MTSSEAESRAAALFLPRPHQAVRKHIRGQKRYYRNVQRKAELFSERLNVMPGEWFDLWHYHADWSGYGNLGWKHRRSHLTALCAVFVDLLRDTANAVQPCQVWLYLDPDDAGLDAVYLNTPNPNPNSVFPYKPRSVQWGLPALEQFLGSFLSAPLRAGRCTSTDTEGNLCTYYIIYSPAHGEALE